MEYGNNGLSSYVQKKRNEAFNRLITARIIGNADKVKEAEDAYNTVKSHSGYCLLALEYCKLFSADYAVNGKGE